MIDLYTFEQTLKLERRLLDEASARRAAWNERLSTTATEKPADAERHAAPRLSQNEGFPRRVTSESAKDFPEYRASG